MMRQSLITIILFYSSTPSTVSDNIAELAGVCVLASGSGEIVKHAYFQNVYIV